MELKQDLRSGAPKVFNQGANPPRKSFPHEFRKFQVIVDKFRKGQPVQQVAAMKKRLLMPGKTGDANVPKELTQGLIID